MEIQDIIWEICNQFNLKDMLKLKLINKLFNNTCNKIINDILTGNIKPDKYFNMIFDINSFDYPIRSFLNNEGDWHINGQYFNNADKHQTYKHLFNFNQIYFNRIGENDEQSWIIVGKSGQNYVYFEGSCDYTGFDCQGGGDLYYCDNWKTLWNMNMDDCVRKLMLNNYGYSFKIK